jgi:hypothetical protein
VWLISLSAGFQETFRVGGPSFGAPSTLGPDDPTHQSISGVGHMRRLALKRKALGASAAVIMAVGLLGALPASSAFAQMIKIFKSPDGKIVMICHYTDSGVLQYCDITTPLT